MYLFFEPGLLKAKFKEAACLLHQNNDLKKTKKKARGTLLSVALLT